MDDKLKEAIDKNYDTIIRVCAEDGRSYKYTKEEHKEFCLGLGKNGWWTTEYKTDFINHRTWMCENRVIPWFTT